MEKKISLLLVFGSFRLPCILLGTQENKVNRKKMDDLHTHTFLLVLFLASWDRMLLPKCSFLFAVPLSLGKGSVSSVQSLSDVQLFVTPWTAWSTPGFPVHHLLPELAQFHVHLVGDEFQPSHSLLSPSPVFSLSQHQDLFQWISSLHQVAKLLELQLSYQSFQWIFRTDFL